MRLLRLASFFFAIPLLGYLLTNRPLSAHDGPLKPPLRLLQQVEAGTNPYLLDVNPLTNRIYVGNVFTNNIQVVDGRTNRVIATIPLSAFDVYGVAVNWVRNRVYAGSGRLSVISGKRNQESASIETGIWPLGIAVDQRRNRIYVTHNASETLVVLDGFNNRVLRTIPLHTGGGAAHVDVNERTNRVYVAGGTNGQLYVFRGGKANLLATVPVGHDTWGVAANKRTNRIYVSGSSDGLVSVVDGRTSAVVATIAVDSGTTRGVAVDEPGNRIYVVTQETGTVSVIDGRTNEIIDAVQVGSDSTGVTFNPVSRRVYVANTGSGTVSVLQASRVPRLKSRSQ